MKMMQLAQKKHPSQNNLEKTLHKHQLGFRTKRATEQLLTLLRFTCEGNT